MKGFVSALFSAAVLMTPLHAVEDTDIEHTIPEF